MNITLNDAADCLHISGDMTLDSAQQCLKVAAPLLEKTSQVHIDLADVNHSDSAGLALLLEWLRYAKTADKPASFFNMPSQMLAMAEASGLDTILPIQKATL